MIKKVYKISDLSPHLFWDVDKESIQWEKDKRLIVARVLDYGMINDWEILKDSFNKNDLKNIATKLPYLTPKALTFISVYLNVSLNNFKCYKNRLSNQEHWIY